MQRRVSRAISSSSSVGTTHTGIVELPISRASPLSRSFAWASIAMPRLSRPSQIRARIARRVFADAAGEDQHVRAIHGSEISPDVLADAITEGIDREARPFIARVRLRASTSRMSFETPERPFSPLCAVEHLAAGGPASHALVRDEVQNGASIHIAAARAHDQAFERRESHRSIDRAGRARWRTSNSRCRDGR